MLTSLRARLALGGVAAGAAALLIHAALTRWPLPALLDALAAARGLRIAAPRPGGIVAAALTLALLLPLALLASSVLLQPLLRLLRALEGVVLAYRDGDFSLSIAAHRRRDELARLVELHNALGHALRDERQGLVERELLLDTLVQSTPDALLLVEGGKRVVYANLAARRLVGAGRSLEGAGWTAVLAAAPAALREALEAGGEGLFAADDEESGEEVFHLSRRALRLRGRAHELVLLSRLTRELSRREVATWKRVIRVMSHELNNSLAPISSLAHTGAELARRGDVERLPEVFATIGERARHLQEFLEGYARVAKLPAPRPAAVAWRPFVESLARHAAFRFEGEMPDGEGQFDAGQIEQALINLLKNAAECGSPPEAVTLAIEPSGGAHAFVVSDRGAGMSEAVMAMALLPFYSTKREGSGLGLALAREIAEAHGGRIALNNRVGGGLTVTMTITGSDAARSQLQHVEASASVLGN